MQTNMCTSHTPNILPLPVYLTHIPKLLKSCIRNSFNPKEALLQQRQTAARFFPSPTARSLPPPWLWHQKSHILSTHRWLKDIPPLRNGAGAWGNHLPDAVLSVPTGHRAHTGLCEPHLSPPQAAIEKAKTFTSALKGSEIYFALGKKLIVTLAHRQGHKDHTVLQHWTLRAVLSPVAALLLLLLEPHCLTGNGRFHSLRNVPGHLFPFLPLHLQTSGKKGTRWNLNFRAKIALP